MSVQNFNVDIYDLECLCNLFTYTGYNYKTKTWFKFVIHKSRNDIKELYEHCKSLKLQIGYNNEGYDYPLLHHILNHYDEYKDLDGQTVAQRIYAKSQYLISEQFTKIADKNKIIPQIDLFLIWHYNNVARHTSLKDLEIAMRMENVEEMPFDHTHWCTVDDIDAILEYNENDVWATYLFFEVTLGRTDYPLYKGKNKIQLRLDLNKKFNVNVMNMGDVPMGEELLLQLYSRAVGINPYVLKKRGGTQRPGGIQLKDCIPYWCNLRTDAFSSFVKKLQTTRISGAKKEFAHSVIFHGYKFDFGQGGAHGCAAPNVWDSDDEWVIADYDVGSLYPSIGKSLQLYPEHLGIAFTEKYTQFIDDRLAEKGKPKADRDMVLIEGYKLILNGAYGKSKEEKSYLYDPLYTFRTTVGGQIFICMWAERWVQAVPDLKFIQTNTDGQTIYVRRKDLDKIRAVNDELTRETGLTIEETIYSKMVVRDVNNYIAVYDDSTKEHEHVKLKGCFEIDKEYHKDPSARIVPLALKEYFLYGTPIEETICNNTDIFNYCMRMKTKSNCTGIFRYLDKAGAIAELELPRTTRYYLSEEAFLNITTTEELFVNK